MKKYLLYIVVIILLGGVAAWYVRHQTNGSGTGENIFAVKDAAKISKITLVDTQKRMLELNRVNGAWIVNGKFPARDEQIQSLLESVTRVTVLCPVAKAAHDNVIRQLLERNVKVDIYTGGDKPVKTYYVGGATPDNEGTYMLLEENGEPVERPSITYLPNTRGYLTFRYSTDEENWRSKVLFNYTEQDIRSVEVEYLAEEEKSFILDRVAPDSFSLQPVNEKYKLNEPYQQKYIRQYLSFYSPVSFEAFDNKYPLRDSMTHTTPYCIITVTAKDNSVNKVSLFHMPINKRSKMQMDEKGNELKFDMEHFHASINGDKDYVIAQYYVLGKILRSYKDFYFKPKETNGPSSSMNP